MANIDRLIADFVKVHHNTPYFELLPYIQFMRAAYALGYDAHDHRFKGTSIKVIRSDGKKYESVQQAASLNIIDRSCIDKALRNKTKSAGYYWRKQEINN